MCHGAGAEIIIFNFASTTSHTQTLWHIFRTHEHTIRLLTHNDSMRILLIIILTCFISTATKAQDNVNQKEMVGFGCYFEGRYTKTVVKVTKLLETKKYKEISKLLASRNKGEKYLAVISLQKLADIGQYNLNEMEKNLIAKARLLDDLVSVCSGCTYFDKVAMKTMLTEDNFIGSDYWLDGTISKK
jgi:hypothetical protein